MTAVQSLIALSAMTVMNTLRKMTKKATLYYAMSSDKEKKKVPQKVSFSYLTHDIGNVEKPVERKTKYVVSPYKLLINDGNYYLLAYRKPLEGD